MRLAEQAEWLDSTAGDVATDAVIAALAAIYGRVGRAGAQAHPPADAARTRRSALTPLEFHPVYRAYPQLASPRTERRSARLEISSGTTFNRQANRYAGPPGGPRNDGS